jgi:hypothetical protein
MNIEPAKGGHKEGAMETSSRIFESLHFLWASLPLPIWYQLL